MGIFRAISHFFLIALLGVLSSCANAVATGITLNNALRGRGDGLLFKEFELILRPGQGKLWPPSSCASNDEGVAQRVTDTLGISNSSFSVVAKVFDTVVMLVNTTGMFDSSSGEPVQINATSVAGFIVESINGYEASNSSTAPPSTVRQILGDYFVGQCEVYKSALEYTPVKVPGYLRQPEEYNRTGFYVLGGLAGLCIVIQAVYGVLHWRKFDMVVLKDADEQSID